MSIDKLDFKSKLVYNTIRKMGITKKHQIVERTGFKSGTVTRILDELLLNQFIEEAGQGESTGGRKPLLYRINPEKFLLIGVDISRTGAALVFSDLNLNIIQKYSWEMNSKMTPEVLFPDMIHRIKSTLEKLRIPALGIGVGVVGPVDKSNQIIIHAFDFPADGWKNFHVAAFFAERIHLPVFVENGASSALRAEYWYGNSDIDNIVYIHLGIGLRSAVMVNNKIFAGTLGEMIIHPGGMKSQNPEGNYGALNSYVTLNYIVHTTKYELKAGRISSCLSDREIDDITLDAIIKAYDQKDDLVTEIYRRAATYFGIGLANIINILHPDQIILGGPLITGNPSFYRISTKVAENNTPLASFMKEQFQKSRLGENSISLGAGLQSLDRYFETSI